MRFKCLTAYIKSQPKSLLFLNLNDSKRFHVILFSFNPKAKLTYPAISDIPQSELVKKIFLFITEKPKNTCLTRRNKY